MLERAVVENCESHERTVVKFDQVTTIVGPNDVGKSAFLRALWWAVANDPAGTEHIRHGAESAAVHLKLDGKWVQRHRGPHENTYTFDGEVYHSLRAPAVPDTVTQFLRLSEANFQWQMDAPFWLTETPGALSKKLNAVVDLAAIDDTLDLARAEVTRAKTVVTMHADRVEAYKWKIDKLAWAEAAAARLTEYEVAIIEASKAESAYEALDFACGFLEEDARYEAWAAEMTAVSERLNLAIGEAMRDAADYAWIDKQVRELEAAIKALPPDIGPEWEELLALRRAGDEAAEYWRVLDAEIRDLEASEERKCRLDEELAGLEERLTTETGGRCPACGKATESSEFLPPTSTSATPSPRPELKLVRSGFTRKPKSSSTSTE